MPAKEGEHQQGFSEDDLQGLDAERYYEIRKQFYRDGRIAERYDELRIAGARSRRHRAEWRAIAGALRIAGSVRELLDVPTGTGRFVPALADAGVRVTGADISREMMTQAQKRDSPAVGFVQCEAEALPFRDGSFDMVASIRFLMHLTPAVRASVLRELARVSRRWVLVDYRHRHAPRNVLKRWAHALGLRRTPAPPRVGREEMRRELEGAGLRVVRIHAVAPLLSDKWFVLCERSA